MKNYLTRIFVFVILAILAAGTLAEAAPQKKPNQKQPKWQLVWADEFDGKKINSEFWSKIPRGGSDWNKKMSNDPSLYDLKNGCLILRGKENKDLAKDPSPLLTGGVWSEGKIAFCYGKLEVRAKLKGAKGAWPAIWLLPNIPGRKWPDDGEIDIMERLNFDNFAYQSLHSRYTQTGKPPARTGTSPIDPNGFNTYWIIWTPDSLTLGINDKTSCVYPRVPAEKANGQWPFDKPFYILLDMQVEGAWVGKANLADLPTEMAIDYVRLYKDANANYKQTFVKKSPPAGAGKKKK